MMAIGAPDYVLRRAENTCHVINRYTELQEHCRAGMPEDVRGNIAI
jgi:hypothetical protein